MLRKIAGVIGGYVFMFAFIIGTFTALYAVLGTERSYQPNSYEVSMLWIVSTFILGLFAAVFAGWMCYLISRSKGAVKVLAGIVLVLGLAMGIFQIVNSKPETLREGEVSREEAMEKSQAPLWVAFLNPMIGVIGILIGGSLKKED